METQSNHPRRGAVAAADGASKPRRRFLGALAASIGGPLLAAVTPVRARAPSHRLHLQDCRIAGSHHYACDALQPRLRVGDALRLRRRSKTRTRSAPSRCWGRSGGAEIFFTNQQQKQRGCFNEAAPPSLMVPDYPFAPHFAC
jgi:hypothetical protein